MHASPRAPAGTRHGTGGRYGRPDALLPPPPPQGALEEARLIDWPSPVDALSNTGVVILIVIGSTGALFGINTALAQLSTIIFR